jgi:hypothetical protein
MNIYIVIIGVVAVCVVIYLLRKNRYTGYTEVKSTSCPEISSINMSNKPVTVTPCGHDAWISFEGLPRKNIIAPTTLTPSTGKTINIKAGNAVFT